MSTQIHDRRVPFERPPRIRSMLTLEVASEILDLAPGLTEADSPVAKLQFREQTQDHDAWYATIVAGGDDAVRAAAENATTLGIIAPRSLSDRAYADGLAVRRVFSYRDSDAICSANAPADFVESICRAIEASTADCRALLEEHVSPVPLHDAAQHFWSRSS
jgi:hypothetical protein